MTEYYQMRTRDSITFRVDVTRSDNGAAKDLTSATLAATAKRPGASNVVGTANSASPATGQIQVTFAELALSVGVWIVHVVVDYGADSQTVAEVQVTVLP